MVVDVDKETFPDFGARRRQLGRHGPTDITPLVICPAQMMTLATWHYNISSSTKFSADGIQVRRHTMLVEYWPRSWINLFQLFLQCKQCTVRIERLGVFD